MAKMRYEYLGIIHRNDLNILFKKGYIVLCTIHVKTISGNDSVPEEYIRELLKNVSPFDYTSEYVFINLKSATTRLYDTEAKIICIVSKKGAQCIECHHKDI